MGFVSKKQGKMSIYCSLLFGYIRKNVMSHNLMEFLARDAHFLKSLIKILTTVYTLNNDKLFFSESSPY